MTRVNCVPVKELTDQHLIAEYREITRVSKLARKLDDYGTYCLGSGHVKFFYNKGNYLACRTRELYIECFKRGFKVSYKDYVKHPEGLNEPWYPTKKDLETNRQRLKEKLDSKQGFYRYYGKAV